MLCPCISYNVVVTPRISLSVVQLDGIVCFPLSLFVTNNTLGSLRYLEIRPETPASTLFRAWWDPGPTKPTRIAHACTHIVTRVVGISQRHCDVQWLLLTGGNGRCHLTIFQCCNLDSHEYSGCNTDKTIYKSLSW